MHTLHLMYGCVHIYAYRKNNKVFWKCKLTERVSVCDTCAMRQYQSFQFFLESGLVSLFYFNFLTLEVFSFWINFFEFFMFDIIISFVFPIYIILKTRRYLPRLWNDNSPLILQNNDFYAVRLSPISPCPSTFAESSL